MDLLEIDLTFRVLNAAPSRFVLARPGKCDCDDHPLGLTGPEYAAAGDTVYCCFDFQGGLCEYSLESFEFISFEPSEAVVAIPAVFPGAMSGEFQLGPDFAGVLTVTTGLNVSLSFSVNMFGASGSATSA